MQQAQPKDEVREADVAYLTTPDTLCAALHRYHYDNNLTSLKRAYENYLHREQQQRAKPGMNFAESIISGFRSFSFRPLTEEDLAREVKELKERAGVNDDRSPFEAAGDYLSLGIIEHILATEEDNA